MPELPLAGLKVIDFGDAWSSPFACTMLADAGADVIRIEDIHRQLSTLRGPVAPEGQLNGYPDREPGERPWNRYFLLNNSERNKLGVTLDFNHPFARSLAERLIADSDIFAINYSPRAVQEMGLTFADLKQLNPRIVYAHVTGYGCEGDLADAVALGSTIDAWTGHMALRGYSDTTPYDTDLSYFADAAGATMLVLGLMAALEERDRTGEAQCIELSLAETLLGFLAAPVMETVVSGVAPAPTGNRTPVWAPQGAYPCAGADRWITIAVRSDAEWGALCGVLGLDATRYPTVDSRRESHDAIDEAIAESTARRDGERLMHQLQAAGVPAMLAYLDSEITDSPELTGDDFLQEGTHPDTGTRTYPGPLWRSSRAPMGLRTPHFGLGEHNHEVLCGRLSITEDEYQSLVADKAIGAKYSFWPE